MGVALGHFLLQPKDFWGWAGGGGFVIRPQGGRRSHLFGPWPWSFCMEISTEFSFTLIFRTTSPGMGIYSTGSVQQLHQHKDLVDFYHFEPLSAYNDCVTHPAQWLDAAVHWMTIFHWSQCDSCPSNRLLLPPRRALVLKESWLELDQPLTVLPIWGGSTPHSFGSEVTDHIRKWSQTTSETLFIYLHPILTGQHISLLLTYKAPLTWCFVFHLSINYHLFCQSLQPPVQSGESHLLCTFNMQIENGFLCHQPPPHLNIHDLHDYCITVRWTPGGGRPCGVSSFLQFVTVGFLALCCWLCSAV